MKAKIIDGRLVSLEEHHEILVTINGLVLIMNVTSDGTTMIDSIESNKSDHWNGLSLEDKRKVEKCLSEYFE